MREPARTRGATIRRNVAFAVWMSLALLASAAGVEAQILQVSAGITTDTTWGDNESEVVLDAPIFVTNAATLTILPGTIVRGQPRSAAFSPPTPTRRRAGVRSS